MNDHINPTPLQRARQLRKSMTDAETILWQQLRNRKLGGFKFRRQHPINHYIADFFCYECRLVVEVDGPYHNEPDQKAYDEARTMRLKELNISVIRFANCDVMERTEFVLKEILHHLMNRS